MRINVSDLQSILNDATAKLDAAPYDLWIDLPDRIPIHGPVRNNAIPIAVIQQGGRERENSTVSIEYILDWKGMKMQLDFKVVSLP